jgi:riboflavin kinase
LGIENCYTLEADFAFMSFDAPTLKALALKGAVRKMVTVSTKELGRELGVSQQTASNRILALLEAGLITRRLGTRGQSVRLTREGVALLRKEYADYQMIFGSGRELRIVGRVSTGLGEGEYYLQRQQYKRQFSQALGFEPYEGTLNLAVTDEEMDKVDIVPDSKMIDIAGFKAEGRTFGEAKCIEIVVGGIQCAIVLPKRSHYTNVIEIISRENLRNGLGLKDGDEVEVVIGL